MAKVGILTFSDGRDFVREGATLESRDTGATIVTKDNLEDPEVQSVLNPSCENPPV